MRSYRKCWQWNRLERRIRKERIRSEEVLQEVGSATMSATSGVYIPLEERIGQEASGLLVLDGFSDADRQDEQSFAIYLDAGVLRAWDTGLVQIRAGRKIHYEGGGLFLRMFGPVIEHQGRNRGSVLLGEETVRELTESVGTYLRQQRWHERILELHCTEGGK